MHGWLILDKPFGFGSTQAVSAVKRALRQDGHGRPKVGHGGTLDPLATGVLPIAIGEATKLAGRMLDSDKVYEFTVRFGAETDTLDAEGKLVATSEARPTIEAVDAVLSHFTGAIEQAPPGFSALKVNGARAYDLARAGEEVTLATRTVTVHSLHVLSELGSGRGTTGAAGGGGVQADSTHPSTIATRWSPSPSKLGEELTEITLTAHVSKGTYIRSLARDMARALGTVGHVTYLRRIKAGPFDLSHAISLDKWAESAKGGGLEHLLLPLRAGLDDIPALALDPDQAGALRQGRVLDGIATDNGLHFAMLGETPIALIEVSSGEARVVRGFNL